MALDDPVWDIAKDLGFLMPDVVAAEAVEADFVSVCELLVTGATGDEVHPTEPSKPKRKRKPVPRGRRKPHEAQQRQAILDLQIEVEMLQDKLELVKYSVALGKPMTKWQTLAQRQRNEARLLRLEQQELRAAVELNRSFIDKMMTQFRKKPCLQQEGLGAEWQVYRLPAERLSRHAAIHAIAKRQRARKDSAFIMAGLYNQSDNLLRVRLAAHSTPNAVDYEVSAHLTLQAPYYVVGQALWETYSRKNISNAPLSMEVIQERIDDSTVYERLTDTRHGIASHAYTIRKFFREKDEHVIVLRSVLEDALTPTMACGIVKNESVWLTVEPLDNASCRLKYLVKLVFDAADNPLSKSMIEGIYQSPEAVQMDLALTEENLFASPTFIPHKIRQLPGYEAFVNRSIQLKSDLRETLFGAMRAFQRTRLVA
ncbi:unnamed protein product [Aphanomyces euteiches]